MQVQPEIIVKGIETTPEIEKQIKRGLNKLEKINHRIIRVRVALVKAQARRQNGNPYQMQVDIEIPDRTPIFVKQQSIARTKIPQDLDQSREGAEHRRGIREESALTLIERTFAAAQRELQKITDKQRSKVKSRSPNVGAVIEKIFPGEGFGFLRTTDGQQVYFNKNSVLHSHWDRLKVGTFVRYAEEIGEKGLQASTVEPVERPGAAEIHGTLHDLPILERKHVKERKTEATTLS